MSTLESFSTSNIRSILEKQLQKDVTIYTLFGTFRGIVGNETFQTPGAGPTYLILKEPGDFDTKVQLIALSDIRSVLFDLPSGLK